MEPTKIERIKITDAIAAMRGNSPTEILYAVSQLTETERLVVSLVLELTAPPVKPKRADAGTTRGPRKSKPQVNGAAAETRAS